MSETKSNRFLRIWKEKTNVLKEKYKTVSKTSVRWEGGTAIKTAFWLRDGRMCHLLILAEKRGSCCLLELSHKIVQTEPTMMELGGKYWTQQIPSKSAWRKREVKSCGTNVIKTFYSHRLQFHVQFKKNHLHMSLVWHWRTEYTLTIHCMTPGVTGDISCENTSKSCCNRNLILAGKVRAMALIINPVFTDIGNLTIFLEEPGNHWISPLHKRSPLVCMLVKVADPIPFWSQQVK